MIFEAATGVYACPITLGTRYDSAVLEPQSESYAGSLLPNTGSIDQLCFLEYKRATSGEVTEKYRIAIVIAVY